MRVRKKPVELDAVQWLDTVESAELLDEFTSELFEVLPVEDRKLRPWFTAQVYDQLHQSWIKLGTGDWILKGTRGECYPVAAEVFDELYEPA